MQLLLIKRKTGWKQREIKSGKQKPDKRNKSHGDGDRKIMTMAVDLRTATTYTGNGQPEQLQKL